MTWRGLRALGRQDNALTWDTDRPKLPISASSQSSRTPKGQTLSPDALALVPETFALFPKREHSYRERKKACPD